MAKKKQHHEEHVDEAWLLPYADMLTLLLALFIVMFAMGQVDKEKLQKASEQFNIVFSGGKGVLKGQGGSSSKGKVNPIMQKNEKIIEQDQMVQTKGMLEEEIKNSGYADKVSVDLNEEGLQVSIQDTVLFNSGDAEIIKNFYPILNEISNLLKGLNNEIKVTGHTDNVPISTSKFKSNWDLSYTRSLNVMKFMVSKASIPPNKFSIQAFGEYKPKFDNSTPEGRSKNRRVEIIIIRKYPVDESATKMTPFKVDNIIEDIKKDK